MNDELTNEFVDTVKETLAEHLGLEVTDISLEDTFMQDLHMKTTDFADFLQELAGKGMETESIDLHAIETVGDLVESLSSHIYTT